MLERLKKMFSGPNETEKSKDFFLIPSAAAILLFEVAWADHDISADEVKQIENALGDLFSLKPEQAIQVSESAKQAHEASISMYGFTREINESFDVEQKYQLVLAMWRLALADQNIHKYEEYTIRNIAELLYISHKDFIRSKLQAKKLLQQKANKAN